MKINPDFIKRIFNLEIKLKKQSDKDKLSKYEDQIPMYDIYSQKIYPINKFNIHERLLNYHYRFINSEVHQWLQNLYEKYSDDKELGQKFKYNLDVISNYNLDILIETSYKTLYKYSPSLGLLVSICKRNSFHQYISHLKPYYSKIELVKLGLNMNVIKNDLDPEYLIDQQTHYKICKTISKNDVSFEEIKKHHEYIVEKNIISWICFYSWTGSFLFNRYLRNIKVIADRIPIDRINPNNNLNPIFLKGLHKIMKELETSPELSDDFEAYRFVRDDAYLMKLKEGDIFVDDGFISTTRDPFYSPGLTGVFGLVLIKIKIPKNKKGVGLFIENFSLFPREEEYLIPPYSRMKLLSKNDNFNYYHTDSIFEKKINRKYEFELIDVDYQKFYQLHKIIDNPVSESINQIEKIILNGVDKINLIENFISLYSSNNKINLKVGKDKIYSLTYQWFDSTYISSYEKFYVNKQKNGLLFSLWDDLGYPILNIELGEEMIVNFVNLKYYGKSYELTDNYINLIYHIGRIFHYRQVYLYHQFKSFIDFSSNYSKNNQIFLNMNLFNSSLYSYIKHGEKYLENLENKKYINFNLGYKYIDNYFNKPIDENILNKVPEEARKCKNMKQLFILIVEKYFYLYQKIISVLDTNIVNNQYVTMNIYDKLVDSGLSDQIKTNILYSSDNLLDDRLKFVFRQPRRIF
jgi:hypothetical protein